MSDALYVICTFSDVASAQVAQAALEANNIPSTLIRDDAGGMMPFFNTLHPVRLAVREEDVELASELLQGVEDDGPEGDDAA